MYMCTFVLGGERRYKVYLGGGGVLNLNPNIWILENYNAHLFELTIQYNNRGYLGWSTDDQSSCCIQQTSSQQPPNVIYCMLNRCYRSFSLIPPSCRHQYTNTSDRLSLNHCFCWTGPWSSHLFKYSELITDSGFCDGCTKMTSLSAEHKPVTTLGQVI